MTIDPATNRITATPYSYDANGNMTNDGLNALTYDAENRAVSAVGATYSYDGNGLRVKKVAGATSTVYIFSGTKVIAEYENGALPGAPTREYIYSGSALLATLEGTATKYHHRDHLSNRVITDAAGGVVEQRGHLPFGETWYESAGSTKWKFTSYERDAESGNDYAMARSYVNRLGRFSAPDRVAGSTSDPQSLNRYTYVSNNPLNRIDPLGMNEANPTGWCPPSAAVCGGSVGDFPGWSFWGGWDSGGGGGGSLWPGPPAEIQEGLNRYLAMVAAAFAQAGGGPGGDPGSDKLTSNRDVLKAMYCLWQRGGYGWQRTERAMWITQQGEDKYGFVQWPWSAEAGREVFRGAIPAGTVAFAHTHPNVSSPRPSE